MPLTTDFRTFWPGTNALIPTNWSEDTDFSDRFLQIDETAGTNGGSNTHSHAGGDHTHTGDGHTHSISSGSASNATTINVLNNPPPAGKAFSAVSHSHGASTSNSATITTDSSTAPLAIKTGEKPPWFKMIIIKPDDALQELPDGCVALWDEDTIPDNWHNADGIDSRIDLDGRFIEGAANGGNGGSTGGNSAHTHTITNHTHGSPSHSHAAADLGISSGSVDDEGSTSGILGLGPTHHNAALSNKDPGSTNNNSTITQFGATNAPSFQKFLAIINETGGQDTPIGTILPFVGTTVPEGWEELIIDRQIEITTTISEIGDLGGDNQHRHGLGTHTHTYAASHNHTVGRRSQINTDPVRLGSPTVAALRSDDGVFPLPTLHSHTWTATSTTPTLQSSIDLFSDFQDVRNLYRTCKLIKKLPPITVKILGGYFKGATIAA